MNLPDSHLLNACVLGLLALATGSAWLQAVVLIGEVGWAVVMHRANEAADREGVRV